MYKRKVYCQKLSLKIRYENMSYEKSLDFFPLLHLSGMLPVVIFSIPRDYICRSNAIITVLPSRLLFGKHIELFRYK